MPKSFGCLVFAICTLLLIGCGGGSGGTGPVPPPPEPPMPVTYAINVTSLPTAVAVRVGQSAEADISWRFTSTAANPTSTSYSVTTTTEGVQITGGTGSSLPNTELTTSVSYECTSIETVEAQLRVSVGTATRDITWDIDCTGQRITVEPIEPSIESIGLEAQSTLMWQYASIGEAPSDLPYAITSNNDAISIEPTEGSALPGTDIVIALRYTCETSGDVAFEITTNVGTATNVSSWQVSCTEETITVVNSPNGAVVSVGVDAESQLSWHYSSAGGEPREIAYTVRADIDGVNVSDPTGSALPESTVSHHLGYRCEMQGVVEIRLTLEVGSASQQLVWQVECTQEQVAVTLAPPDLTIASVDSPAMVEIWWLVQSSATQERSFSFTVHSPTTGVQVMPSVGSVRADQEVITRVVYECREVGMTSAIVVIQAGNAVHELPWAIECSQERVTIVENPHPASASVGKMAASAFHWYATTTSLALDELAFSIRPQRDEVLVTQSAGKVAPNEDVETNIMFVCESLGELTLEISIEVGSAVEVVSWDVECSEESIEFVSDPFPETVLAVGETATVELSWVLETSAQASREFSYEVSADNGNARISNPTGVTTPGEPSTHEVAYTCGQGGEFDVALSVTAGSTQATTLWPVVCILDTISILSAPESQRVPVGDSVIGNLRWQFRSSYPGREVSFEISSPTRGLQIQNSEGTVLVEGIVESRLRYACSARRNATVALHIKAGGAERDLSWQIECVGEDLTQFEALFYQGPQIGGFRFESGPDGWSSSSIAHADVGLQEPLRFRTNRQVFVEIRTEHDELVPLPIALRLTVGTEAIEIDQIGEAETKVIEAESDYKYVSRFLFDISVDAFTSPNMLEILIDPESRYPEFDETNNRASFTFDAGNTLDLPKLNVTFVPIRTQDGVPDVSDIEPFVQPLYELMPVGTIEVSIGDELDASDLSWTLDSSRVILDRLHDQVLSAPDSDTYYQGIVRRPEEQEVALCGNAFLDSTVSITVAQCAKHIGAHELGHNFDLRHAPACGAEDTNVDPNYPYEAGDIGLETGWLMQQKLFIDGSAPTEFVQLDYRYYDVMSYCPELFTSRYSYGRALSYLHGKYGIRASRQIAEPVASEFDRVLGRSVVISGSVGPESDWASRRIELVNLDPRHPEPKRSEYFIVVVDGGSGTVLHREPLPVLKPAHADDDHLSWGARIPYFESDELHVNIVDRDNRTVLRLDLSVSQ